MSLETLYLLLLWIYLAALFVDARIEFGGLSKLSKVILATVLVFYVGLFVLFPSGFFFVDNYVALFQSQSGGPFVQYGLMYPKILSAWVLLTAKPATFWILNLILLMCFAFQLLMTIQKVKEKHLKRLALLIGVFVLFHPFTFVMTLIQQRDTLWFLIFGLLILQCYRLLKSSENLLHWFLVAMHLVFLLCLRSDGVLIFLLFPFLLLSNRKSRNWVRACLAIFAFATSVWGMQRLAEFRLGPNVKAAINWYHAEVLMNPLETIIFERPQVLADAKRAEALDRVIDLQKLQRVYTSENMWGFYVSGVRGSVSDRDYALFWKTVAEIFYENQDLFWQSRSLMMMGFLNLYRQEPSPLQTWKIFSKNPNLPRIERELKIHSNIEATLKDLNKLYSFFDLTNLKEISIWHLFFMSLLPHVTVLISVLILGVFHFLKGLWSPEEWWLVGIGLLAITRLCVFTLLSPASDLKYNLPTWLAGSLILILYFSETKSKSKTL